MRKDTYEVFGEEEPLVTGMEVNRVGKEKRHGLEKNSVGVEKPEAREIPSYDQYRDEKVSKFHQEQKEGSKKDVAKWAKEIDVMLQEIKNKADNYNDRGLASEYNNLIAAYNAMKTPRNFVLVKIRENSADVGAVTKKFHEVVSGLYKEVFGRSFSMIPSDSMTSIGIDENIEFSPMRSTTHQMIRMVEPRPNKPKYSDQKMGRVPASMPGNYYRGAGRRYKSIATIYGDGVDEVTPTGAMRIVNSTVEPFRPEEVFEKGRSIRRERFCHGEHSGNDLRQDADPLDFLRVGGGFFGLGQIEVEGDRCKPDLPDYKWIGQCNCPICHQTIRSELIMAIQGIGENNLDTLTKELKDFRAEQTYRSAYATGKHKQYDSALNTLIEDQKKRAGYSTTMHEKYLTEQEAMRKSISDLINQIKAHIENTHNVAATEEQIKLAMGGASFLRPFSSEGWGGVGNAIFVICVVAAGAFLLPVVSGSLAKTFSFWR